MLYYFGLFLNYFIEYLGGTYAYVVDIVTVVIVVCRVVDISGSGRVVAISGRVVAISGRVVAISSVVTTHVDVGAVLHFLALLWLLVPTPRMLVLPISLG